MANKPTGMLQVKKALQLMEEGRSERYISSKIGISRNTVRHYLFKFHSSGLSLTQALLLSDAELSSLIYEELSEPVKGDRQQRFEGMHPINSDFFP